MAEERCLDEAALARLHKLGGTGFVNEMIDLFLQHGAERVAAAQAGLAAGDLRAVEHAAHALKSSAGNLGAVAVQHLAGQIEETASAQQAEPLPDLVNTLASAFARVQDRLLIVRNGGTP